MINLIGKFIICLHLENEQSERDLNFYYKMQVDIWYFIKY